MAILDKRQLAGYLIFDYNEKFQRRISPIKLQKGMYFLYAFWAQFAHKLNVKGEGVSEIEVDTVYEEDLFDAKFEAWKYGPVDRELYTLFNDKESITPISAEVVFSKTDDTVITYIDDILSQIYKVNDFSLVDLSHEDEVWIKTYESNAFGNGEMLSEDIKNEYISRSTEAN